MCVSWVGLEMFAAWVLISLSVALDLVETTFVAGRHKCPHVKVNLLWTRLICLHVMLDSSASCCCPRHSLPVCCLVLIEYRWHRFSSFDISSRELHYVVQFQHHCCWPELLYLFKLSAWETSHTHRHTNIIQGWSHGQIPLKKTKKKNNSKYGVIRLNGFEAECNPNCYSVI